MDQNLQYLNFFPDADTGDTEWLQYSFGTDRYITGIQSRGRPSPQYPHSVKTFEIQFMQNNTWYSFTQVSVVE